jgi:hypothetical protein
METEGFASRAWLGQWMAPEEEPVNNYYEDHKLMEGALIKLGDYAHYRYFLLFRNGRFCYYELPMPASTGTGTAAAGGEQNRKRLEMQLAGYSPTGQLMSWKLRAAKDAIFVKWERAFRLALRPIWMQNTPKCMVCKRDFGFFIRPHHCRCVAIAASAWTNSPMN